MKKLFSLILLAVLAGNAPVLAQNTKAKTLLDRVSNNIKKAGSITADFTFSVNNAKGVSQMKQSGNFRMKKEMYAVILKGGQEIYCDGHSVWTYFPANKEVQIASYDPATQTISPAQLLSGTYEKDYKYAYSGSKTVNGIKADIITLSPKQNADFQKIDLYIDPIRDMVIGGKAYIPSGGTYDYTISNLKAKVNLSSKDFKFNKGAHPGVEVVDVRF